MTHKHVPVFLLLLLCSHVLFAQSMKPASPQLRTRLLKYAADNHLQPNVQRGLYMVKINFAGKTTEQKFIKE